MIHVPTKPLADAVGIINPAVKGSSVSPLHVKANDDTITFRLYGQYGIVHKVKADIDESLEFYIDFHTFADVVKGLQGAAELVSISLNENRLEMSCGTFKPRLSVIDNESDTIHLLHGLPEFDSLEAHTTLTDDMLFSAMNEILYATAVAEYQAIFKGICIDPQDSGMRIVATDGFRLAYKNLTLTSPVKYVLGRNYIPAIVRTFADARDISITFTRESKADLERPTQVVIANDSTLLIVELMEGTFPNYERIIPSDFVTEFDVDADEFEDVIKRVMMLAPKDSNNRIDMVLEKDILKLSSSSDKGVAADEITVENVNGSGAWSFNGQYLLDSTHQFSGETVRFRFSGATSPTVIAPINSESLAMVVPLRTS